MPLSARELEQRFLEPRTPDGELPLSELAHARR
jgi:hypothetical protein